MHIFSLLKPSALVGVHVMPTMLKTTKKKGKNLISLLPLLTLVGCDPGYVLYVHNRSGTKKEVEVIYTSEKGQRAKGIKQSSLVQIYSNPASGNVIKEVPLQVLRKDSITKDWLHSYSFILPPGRTASIDHGIGRPPGQLIILDKRDSISTDRHNGRLRNKSFFFPLHSVYFLDIN